MGGRPWSATEDWQLLGLVERDLTLAEIAARLGRGIQAVEDRLTALGVRVRDARGYTTRAVAERLGVDWHRVAEWVRRGWLRSRTAPIRTATFRLISHEQLLQFLADERYWHLWETERIRDSALREWAREVRGDVRYLTVAEAARRLCMTPGAVNKAVREGRLTAVRRGTCVGAPWLIRSDQLVLAPDGRRGRGRSVTDAEREYIRRWWGQRPATVIGRELGRPGVTVCAVAARMGLPRLGRGYWRTATRMRDRQRWLTVAEVARMLGMSASGVQLLIRSGQLMAVTDGAGRTLVDRVTVRAEARRRYHRYVQRVLTGSVPAPPTHAHVTGADLPKRRGNRPPDAA